MTTRRKVLAYIGGMTAASALGAPIRSLVGGQANRLEAKAEHWDIPYITEGLIDVWDASVIPYQNGIWTGALGKKMSLINSSTTEPTQWEGYLEFDGNCGLQIDLTGKNLASLEVVATTLGINSQSTSTPTAFSIKASSNNNPVSRISKSSSQILRGVTNKLGDNSWLTKSHSRISVGTYVYDGTRMVWYADGQRYASGNWNIGTLDFVCLGYQTGSAISYSGAKVKIYSVRAYTKVLTAEEVAFNYAVDKERFGL